MAGGVSQEVSVAGAATGIPSDAEAVVLNLTASEGSAASFLTAYPYGSSKPTAANLNFGAGQVIGNRVTVPVGAKGAIDVYNNSGDVRIDVDLDGYYTGSATETGSGFVPLASPVRLVDTRTSTGGTTLASDASEIFSFASDTSILADAIAVAGNVTIVAGNAPGFLTVFPTTDTTPPLAADVNWAPNGIVPNFTVVPLNASSTELFNSNGAPANVVIDAFGYFGPAVAT
jgi:hypothetical protein